MLALHIRLEKVTVSALTHISGSFEDKLQKTSADKETTGLMCPQAFEWRRAVTFVRRTFRLKTVDADLRRRVHVPTRLGEGGRNMAHNALRLTIEDGFTANRGSSVETALRGRGRRNTELIQL